MLFGKILTVPPGSLADELELVPGDKVLEINGMRLRDIIDLSFAMSDEEIDLLIEHEDGEQEMISFEKDMDEELGVEFESAVFDGIRNCANHCYFCFVDQVAPHMRDSLNIRDDDYRMSFLYGNFITMSNMVEADFKRIEQYHLSPLFVSVQTTNMELRAEILRCKRAAILMDQLDRLEQGDIEYHCQIVLCPELNDGAELERSISDITKRIPHALSLAIVPVGLTKFRQDCYPLRGFNAAEASNVIDCVEKWQKKLRNEYGKSFVYLGDEFYFIADRELPPEEFYDGFPQLDNGIGLARNFLSSWEKHLERKPIGQGYDKPLNIDVVTGTAVAPMFKRITECLDVPNLNIRIIPVENKHFGTTVNVSGLLTGHDILETLMETSDINRDGIILPEGALRAGENIFLDDMTLDEMREKVGIRIETALGADDLLEAVTGWNDYHRDETEQAYMWQSNAAYTKPLKECKTYE